MNRGFESDLSVIRNMLAETKVDSFLAERRGPQHPPVDILALTEDMTIGTALEKMAEKSVISAPLLKVIEAELTTTSCAANFTDSTYVLTTQADRSDYVGFLSLHDILQVRAPSSQRYLLIFTINHTFSSSCRYSHRKNHGVEELL